MPHASVPSSSTWMMTTYDSESISHSSSSKTQSTITMKMPKHDYTRMKTGIIEGSSSDRSHGSKNTKAMKVKKTVSGGERSMEKWIYEDNGVSNGKKAVRETVYIRR